MTRNEAGLRLLTWFARVRRELPWRRDPRDPYHVWISEVMLQQTQVATVVAYFERWIRRFPHIPALAAASMDEVLKMWEGLGYYSRARNLHKASQVVMERYEGRLPRSPIELQSLPGIGPYTAAAIASIAFGEQVVAVDGNIRRVASRLFALPGPVPDGETRRLLTPLFSGRDAGRINEALMELGALCCTPSTPSCGTCPLRSFCRAFREGAPEAYPVAVGKKKVSYVEKVGLMILEGDRILLKKRPENEMLGGLWGIPLAGHGEPLSVGLGIRLAKVSHAYTHFKITVTPLVVKLRELEGTEWITGGRLIPFDHISSLALSRLDHKMLEKLQGYLRRCPG